MISSTAEYALRAVVFLADKRDRSCSSGEIADATQVPSHYLSKILGDLARHGIVSTRRGPGGGCRLTSAPEDLTIYDVLAAVDPPKRILTCPLEIRGHAMNLCPLHRRLDDAMLAAEQAFRRTTIKELMEEAISDPACSFPLRPKDAQIAEATNDTQAPQDTDA